MVLFVNKERVIEAKEGKMSLNGEVILYVKTINNNHYKCTGDYIDGKVDVKSHTSISQNQFENPSSIIKTQFHNLEVQESLSDNEPLMEERGQPLNHFEDARFFGGGKLNKVTKSELEELAMSITGWTNKTTVPIDAIVKTFDYMNERFECNLTAQEIKEFTIDLLNIRTEQFESTIGKPKGQKDIAEMEDLPLFKTPKILVDKAKGGYGFRIVEQDVGLEVGSSKIGGYPDLLPNIEETSWINDYYFVLQVNTKELTSSNYDHADCLISFFINKSFTNLDYYKANRLKVIITPNEDSFVSQNQGQDVIDTIPIRFDTLDARHFQDQDYASELIVTSQLFPDLSQDSFAEQLLRQSFSNMNLKEFKDRFPELNSLEQIEMVPLVKLKSSQLRISEQSLYGHMNIIFFTSKNNFEISNFEDCYYVIEP